MKRLAVVIVMLSLIAGRALEAENNATSPAPAMKQEAAQPEGSAKDCANDKKAQKKEKAERKKHKEERPSDNNSDSQNFPETGGGG